MRGQIYDEQIAPLLLKAAKLCEANNLSMIARVEYAPEEFGTTGFMDKSATFPMRLVDWAARCNGNVDALIMKIQNLANEQKIRTSVFVEILNRAMKLEQTTDN